MSSTVAAAFSRRRNAHGFERFVSHDDFEKTALFKSDRFTIRCQLTVVDPVSVSPFGQMDQSVVLVQAPPPHISPDPSMALLTASALPPSPPPPKPSILGARSPSVATPLPSASPAPSVAMSSAPAPSVRPEPPVSGARGPSASVPAGQPVVRAKVPPLLSGLNLNADLGRLLETKNGADVELEVRGKVYAAHKCVLCSPPGRRFSRTNSSGRRRRRTPVTSASYPRHAS